MAFTLCLSCSSGLLNRRPRGSLCWMLATFTASYQHLLWTPNFIGLPEGPLGRMWLSLPHLVSNCMELSWKLRLIRAQRPLRPDVAFPTPTRLQLPQLLSWLRYITVQCLHDRPLDLWNRMFNRHQAEITVMQFRGHSSGASVYESIMGYFYLVPFHQPISTHAISCHNCH